MKTGLALLAVGTLLSATPARPAETPATLVLRGRPQTLHLYGRRGDWPVIVSSGDGGWIHVGPDVSAALASHGYFVVGLDVRAYLESFTTAKTTLRPEDEPGDYRTLVDFAAQSSTQKPILIGVSEGASLSVLAGADRKLQPALAGVIAIGMPSVAELGWRLRDAMIYVTHGVPNEPTFNTTDVIDRVSPLPLAAIHSTHDEYVGVDDARQLMAHAREPKRLWIVDASNHRFSGNRAEFDNRLFEAVDWILGRSSR